MLIESGEQWYLAQNRIRVLYILFKSSSIRPTSIVIKSARHPIHIVGYDMIQYDTEAIWYGITSVSKMASYGMYQLLYAFKVSNVLEEKKIGDPNGLKQDFKAFCHFSRRGFSVCTHSIQVDETRFLEFLIFFYNMSLYYSHSTFHTKKHKYIESTFFPPLGKSTSLGFIFQRWS